VKRLLVGVVLTLVISACGGSASDDTGDAVGADGGDLSGTVQVLVIGDSHEAAAYGELVAAFEDQVPGIDVQLVTAADRNDQMTRLSTSFSAGDPPDLFVMNYRFVGQFAERDVLVPLDEMIAESDDMEESDFYQAALDAFRFDENLLCLPQNLSSLVVYYNQDLFAEEGVTEPEENWQWMDFVEKAKVLTKDLDGDDHPDQYGIGIDAGQIIRLAPFIWSGGAELVDDQEQPTRFTLDSPEARVVLGNYFALRRAHQVIPTEEEVQAESDEARFLNGRTAMLVESRRVVPILRSITEFDWDVAPLPLFGTQQGVLHSDGYCMTRDGGNHDAAWRFMEFALSEEGATIMAQTGRTVPSRIAVAESDAFLDPDAKPANSQVFVDAGPTLRSLPHISTWPEIEAEVRPILESAMYHDLPPETLNDLLMGATGHLFEPASDD
jgi:multiple sugar transport system substrate-binding protein